MQTMYEGMINSPETTITNNISNSDTLIYVLDPTRVPSDLPNLMTLGTSSNAETVKVLSISGNALTVERGFQGTPTAWNAGTIIARNFTEYDYGALLQNIMTLFADKVDIANIVDNLTSTDANKPLSAKQGKVLGDLISSNLTKMNLLHNWDFRNPINQREQSSYTSASNGAYNYTLDCWRQIYTGFTVAINSGYIKLSTSGTNGLFNQVIENASSILPNKTWTITVIYKNCVGTVSAGLSGQAGTIPLGDGIFTKTVTTSSGYAGATVDIMLSAGASIDVYAIKLELGLISTLANDPPAIFWIGSDLTKKFFKRIKAGSVTSLSLGYAKALTATSAELVIKTEDMRIIPTITGYTNVNIEGAAVSAATVFGVSTDNEYINIRFVTTGLTTGTLYRVLLPANAYIDLSADL